MPGYNLWTWRDFVLFLMESRMDAAASPDLVEPLLFRFLNDAHLEACRLAGFRRSSEIAVDAVAGQYEYDIPSSVLADRIVHVRFNSGDTSWVPLTFVSPRIFAELIPDPSVLGVPRYYTVIPDSRVYLLGPTPETSGSDTIRLVAETMPESLSRLYRSSQHNVTASLTNGSRVVPLSSAVSADQIAAGDEFGVALTTQSDGSSIHGATPSLWFVVESLDVALTSLTLAEPYPGASVSSVNFFSAQVPAIERMFPGLYGYLVAELAVARILSTRAPEESDRLRANALAGILGQSDSSWRCAAARTGVSKRTTMLRGY